MFERVFKEFEKTVNKNNTLKKPTKTIKVSIGKTRRFHRKKHLIEKTILGTLDDGEIIYGEQALKKRFPKWLERQTIDFDIYAKHPKREAIETEQALDRRFGGDFFKVEPAQHEGTWKVISNVNNQGYADFSIPDEPVPFDKIGKHNYVSLEVEKKHRRKSLSDPDSSWRHGKDRDALNRILIYEKMKRR